MLKEWTAWMNFQAVDVIEWKDVPKDAEIIDTRWVHVDKASVARAPGQNSKIEPKSRLVVIGCQEKAWIRSDSPTCSTLAFRL
eukprot:5959581-Amphidinium_carterae.1